MFLFCTHPHSILVFQVLQVLSFFFLLSIGLEFEKSSLFFYTPNLWTKTVQHLALVSNKHINKRQFKNVPSGPVHMKICKLLDQIPERTPMPPSCTEWNKSGATSQKNSSAFGHVSIRISRLLFKVITYNLLGGESVGKTKIDRVKDGLSKK